VRHIPSSGVVAHPKLHMCVLLGWESYQQLASDDSLELGVVPIVDLWLPACVCDLVKCKNSKALRLKLGQDKRHQLGVVPMP